MGFGCRYFETNPSDVGKQPVSAPFHLERQHSRVFVVQNAVFFCEIPHGTRLTSSYFSDTFRLFVCKNRGRTVRESFELHPIFGDLHKRGISMSSLMISAFLVHPFPWCPVSNSSPRSSLCRITNDDMRMVRNIVAIIVVMVTIVTIRMLVTIP